MKIVVCIKQVPATTNVRIDPETNALIREGVESQVNPFDENALEAALQVKDGYDGECQVIALTMGPPQAEAALRDAVAMGCDDAILLTDGAFRGADTLATSYTLAQAIRRIGDVDLVLCGKQAIDGDTAQVGPGVAEHLGGTGIFGRTQQPVMAAETGVVTEKQSLDTGLPIAHDAADHIRVLLVTCHKLLGLHLPQTRNLVTQFSRVFEGEIGTRLLHRLDQFIDHIGRTTFQKHHRMAHVASVVGG